MNPAIQPLRFLMQWVLKQWFHCRTNTEVLEQPGMPPQGTDWNYDKKNFSGSRKFFSRGLNAPLVFYFFTLMGTKKTFWSPKCFFSLVAHALSNFCPPRFLNLIKSPRLNCKDSPRTSSALALNYAEVFMYCLTSPHQKTISTIHENLLGKWLRGEQPLVWSQEIPSTWTELTARGSWRANGAAINDIGEIPLTQWIMNEALSCTWYNRQTRRNEAPVYLFGWFHVVFKSVYNIPLIRVTPL